MASVRWTLVLLLASVFVAYHASGEGIDDKIYEHIGGALACFRKLNATHQIGCTSSRSGNVGVIYLLENEQHLEWFLKNASDGPYVIVVVPATFTRDILLNLKASGKVNGIVLIRGNETYNYTQSFTHELHCPNEKSGMYEPSSEYFDYCFRNPWNPHGSGLLFEDWGFPIFFVGDKHAEDIRKCYKTFNEPYLDEGGSRALCAMELKSNMLAAVDTPTCIRRSKMITSLNKMYFCDPLGDKNIISTLVPYNESQVKTPSERTVIVVASRLDTVSLFDQLMPGGISPVTNIVATIAVAKALGDARKNGKLPAILPGNVLFAFFNGETYDYIGSQRAVYDMNAGVFPAAFSHTDDSNSEEAKPVPLNLKHIKYFIELNQVSNKGGNNKYFVHTDPISYDGNKEEIDNLIKELSGSKTSIDFVKTDDKMPLPPASLQTFLKEDRKIAGIVITDHEKEYTNNYYHSIFDDGMNLKYTYNVSDVDEGQLQAQIANLATAVARAVCKLLDNGSDVEDISVGADVVNELLNCYLETANCTLFRAAATKKDKIILGPWPLYVGVGGDASPYPGESTKHTRNVLALLTGQQVDLCESKCDGDEHGLYQNIWMRGENESHTWICMQSTVKYTDALSPAFKITDYDWKTGKYSSWTESRWSEYSARLFLRPSKRHEVIAISVGTTILVVSFLLVYLINSKASVLFNSRLSLPVC